MLFVDRFVSSHRSRDILRGMKRTTLLILASCCLVACSCTTHDRMQSGPPAPTSPPASSPSPPHDNVAGGFAAPEPGEPPLAEFKAMLGISEKKRPNTEPALL